MNPKLNFIKKIELDNSFDLFNNLSNENRIKILLNLLKENSSLAEISRLINQSNSSSLGHLNKLVISGLVQKSSDGNYFVTEFGKSILFKIPSFDFIKKHRNFFKDHTFGDTPSWLLHCIGMLSKAEYVDGAVGNFQRWKKLIETANDFFYGIFTQTPHRTDFFLSDKLVNGLKIKLIFGKNGLMSDYSNLAKLLNFDKTTSQEILERRSAKSVFVNIMISENQACIMFPDKKNNIDAGRTFISTDRESYQWCLSFFNYKWNESEPFSRFRNFN